MSENTSIETALACLVSGEGSRFVVIFTDDAVACTAFLPADYIRDARVVAEDDFALGRLRGFAQDMADLPSTPWARGEGPIKRAMKDGVPFETAILDRHPGVDLRYFGMGYMGVDLGAVQVPDIHLAAARAVPSAEAFGWGGHVPSAERDATGA